MAYFYQILQIYIHLQYYIKKFFIHAFAYAIPYIIILRRLEKRVIMCLNRPNILVQSHQRLMIFQDLWLPVAGHL